MEDNLDIGKAIRQVRLLRWSLLLVIAVGFIGFASLLIFDRYENNYKKIGDPEQRALLAIVNTLVHQIDGDAYERMLSAYPSKDAIKTNEDDSFYHELSHQLKAARVNNQLTTEIYILTLETGGHTEHLKNAAFFGASSAPKPYYRYPYTPTQAFADLYLKGGMLAPYSSQSGTWVSAIAPIKNQEGQVVGVVEADMKLDPLVKAADASFRSQLVSILGLSIPALMAICFLVFFITRIFLKSQIEVYKELKESNAVYRELSEFADAIGNGNYDLNVEHIKAHGNTLSNALLTMQTNLRKSRERETKRNWIINGIAEFSQILRENNRDISLLCNSIISKIVAYTKTNKGIIYLVENKESNHPYLQPWGYFAASEKELNIERIAFKEGLVGQVWADEEPLFIDQVRADHHPISSGLGEAAPSAVFIVPLVHNSEVYGVMEVASLAQLKAHEREFIEKVAESIAATISIVKVNAQTAELLAESQELTEKFRMQEEEMRQNHEELQATQEELQRRITELENTKNKDGD